MAGLQKKPLRAAPFESDIFGKKKFTDNRATGSRFFLSPNAWGGKWPFVTVPGAPPLRGVPENVFLRNVGE